VAIALLLVDGCASTTQDDPFGDRRVNIDFDAGSAPLAEISSLFDVRIPYFAIEHTPTSTALQKLESAWRAQTTAHALPVSLSAVPVQPEGMISLSASDLRVRELLYIIADLSGATYINGRLCGSIRVQNQTGTARSSPQATQFNRLFVFDGFKDGGTAQRSPPSDGLRASPEE
jgi:hypothetical protein